MADVITPTERAAIDAAIAAGRVQVIPTGATTQPKYVWEAKGNAGSGRLVSTAGTESWMAQNNRKRAARRRKAS